MMWQKNIVKKVKQTKPVFVLLVAVCFIFANIFFAGSAEAQTRNSGCYTAKDYVNINSECFLCPMFKKIFDTFSVMGENIYNSTGTALASVIAWGFMLWLIILVLKVVSSVTPVSPGEMFTRMGKQLFRVILAMAFCKASPSIIFGYIVEPVLITAFSFATAVSGANCDSLPTYVNESGIFSGDLSTALVCMITAVQNVVGFIQGIGGYLICVSWSAGWWGLLPAFGPLISGIVLYVTMLIIIFNYTLQVIDALFRLAMFCALMPLFIGAWAFDITKSFAQKGWEMLVSVSVTFICLALAISMSFFMFDVIFSGGMSELVSAVNSDDVAFLGEAFEVSGLSIVKVVIICIFSCAIISKAPAFGDHFAEVSWRSDDGPAAQLGEMAFAAMDPFDRHSMAGRNLRVLGGAAQKGASKVGDAVGTVIGNRMRRNSSQSGGQGAFGAGGRKNPAFAGAGATGKAAANNLAGAAKAAGALGKPSSGSGTASNLGSNSGGSGSGSSSSSSSGGGSIYDAGSGSSNAPNSSNAQSSTVAATASVAAASGLNIPNNPQVLAANNPAPPIHQGHGINVAALKTPPPASASNSKTVSASEFTSSMADIKREFVKDLLTQDPEEKRFLRHRYREYERDWRRREYMAQQKAKRDQLNKQLFQREQEKLRKQRVEQEKTLKKLKEEEKKD
ncbi:MAG: hypothetical protein AB7U85_03440 [Alphaproteobacteria bacterium]